MPVIGRHVGLRHYPQLEQRKGGSILGSVGVALGGMLIFMGLWYSPCRCIFPPLAVVVQALLWGWLTCRVMVYDTLADYASRDERRQIRQHRWRCWRSAWCPARRRAAGRDLAGRRDGGGVLPVPGGAVDLAVCADFYLYRFVVRVLLHGCAGAVARARSHF
jgi:hypothetical protein